MYKRNLILLFATFLLLVLQRMLAMRMHAKKKHESPIERMVDDVTQSTMRKMKKFSPALYRRKRRGLAGFLHV